jgi:hypothetical protein
MDLYLRKVAHTQARDNYRVILKMDDEVDVGSIGFKTFTSDDTHGHGALISWSCFAPIDPKATRSTLNSARPASPRPGSFTAKRLGVDEFLAG